MKRIAQVLFASVSLFAATSLFADGYSFKLHNTTDNTIKRLLVSPDGQEYGYFDIGKGIKPGETTTLTWSKSADSDPCKEYIKAVFDDGSESKPVKFDFCEDDLELEF